MIGEDFHQRFSWNEKEHFSEMKLSTNLFDDTRLCSSLRETHMIGGHVQKESIMCGIIILLTPAPIIDPFRAWKPPLCHKDTARGKKCPKSGALGALSCVFMA